jgi:flagellar biogenesis protein FliO
MRVVFLWLCVVLPVLAAEPVFTNAEWEQTRPTAATPGSTAAPAAPSTTTALLSIGLSLAGVLALAVGLGWVVKKAGVKRLLPRKGEHLELLETLPLGFKRQVHLVRVQGQVVLIGSGEHDLVALGSFAAAASPTPAPAPTPVVVDDRFAGLLDKALGRTP